jgi:hypothetical protein
MERGEAISTEDKTLRDHITEYQAKAKDAQMGKVAEAFGLDESKLPDLLGLKLAMPPSPICAFRCPKGNC